jgi:hypothetical protein
MIGRFRTFIAQEHEPGLVFVLAARGALKSIYV